MQKELIGNRELIETMRKMAIESGLSENVLDEFLEECASEFGSVGLLRNLAGAGFDLELAINSYEYMRKRRPISDFLPDLFTEDDKVLSIGCGSGVAEVNLALAGFQVWGVDTNKSGVDIARKLAEEIGLSQDCRFMEVSGYEYPFEDSFFGVILYSHSLHEIDEQGATLEESHRLLKKDGHVIVLEDGNARKDVVESIENSEFNTAGEYAIPVGNIFGHGSKTSIVAIVLEKT